MKQTKKTIETEKWVDMYIKKHKYPPTYREISKGLNISETASFVRCRTFRDKLKMSKRTKNKFQIGTFESALEYMKCGHKAKREIVKNDTVIIVHKKELMQMCESTGVRYPYQPTNEDILSTDWQQLPS